MESSNLRMAQFSAVKEIMRRNAVHSQDSSDEYYAGDFFKKEAAIALNLLMDCYLLVDIGGTVVLANSKGENLLKKLQMSSKGSYQAEPAALPKSVWQACRSLLENCEYLSDNAIPPQAILSVPPDIELRISLLETDQVEKPLFLITVEDKRQKSLAQATVDQRLYGLTKREKDVWALRLRECSYQEIADELFVTVNTVKKHMKTILAKQEQWRSETFELLAS